MKIRELIEQLKSFPQDATVIAWDPDGDVVAEISGLRLHQSTKYFAHPSNKTQTGVALEIQSNVA